MIDAIDKLLAAYENRHQYNAKAMKTHMEENHRLAIEEISKPTGEVDG